VTKTREKIIVKKSGKYNFKKSKPWNKRDNDFDIFENVTGEDLASGFFNEGHGKKFAKHNKMR